MSRCTNYWLCASERSAVVRRAPDVSVATVRLFVRLSVASTDLATRSDISRRSSYGDYTVLCRPRYATVSHASRNNILLVAALIVSTRDSYPRSLFSRPY